MIGARLQAFSFLLIISFITLWADDNESTKVQIELPTMGWSSWNTYRVNINDSLIMRQADAMVNKGLKDVGYKYVNIDDGYFGGRDSKTGQLLIHPTRFPIGLKSVVEHIHSLGLKAGIYSDAGANTCGNWYDKDSIAEGVGLYGHDQQDADFFFRELEFDFIKVDFCGGNSTANKQHYALDPKERYTAISNAILATGRKDVRLNVCRWDYPGTWVSDVAVSWRMSQDISARWSSVRNIIQQNLYLSAYAGNGHYNDMDMLEVGRGLNDEEERTHFGMWCMMSSPLLIGCDLTKIKDKTLELLTNKELIAINQDVLGIQASVVKHDINAGTYVLVKDIETLNGLTRAVALYNPTDEEKNVEISFDELLLGGKVKVRDVYNNVDLKLEKKATGLSMVLPPHATRIYRITGEKRLEQTIYEAETAYLPCYQELYNPKAVGTAYYEKDSLCRGGMKVVNVGIRPENTLEWRDVYVRSEGDHKVEIHFADVDRKCTFYAASNDGAGQQFDIKDINGRILLVTLPFRQGRNTIRLYSDKGIMPSIDYMRIY